MFASPVWLLGMSMATLLAAFFHLLVGNGAKQAILYWFTSAIGFFVGQLIGSVFLSSWPTIGQVSIVPAVMFSCLAMLVARGLKLC
ncbi:MAG: hypothetical protein GXX94_04110 [Chloroflexi bacterium]|nr:hypothetical protein [Chloroflexota bacterium]